MKRTLALILSLVMCLGLLAGCGDKNTDNQTKDENTPLVVGYAAFNEKFSPFFSETEYDQDVWVMTSLGLLNSDRQGQIIMNGIEGETHAYNGTDYTYYGPADCEIVENADGTVDYNFTMRDDIVFSDGEKVTIDDVIFSMYVLCDPTYDGNFTLYAVPIQGMAAYRSGMTTLAKALAAAGRDNADFTYWTEEQQTKFWDNFDKGLVPFAQGIVDACVEAGMNDEGDVAGAAANWGFDGLAADATVEDFAMAIGEQYGWSFSAMEKEVGNSDALSAMMDEDVYADYPTIGVKTGDSAANISGIKKTGDYSMTVTLDKVDATAIYQLGVTIAPLHYYGDTSLYDYDNNQFGFPKGDLSSVRAKTTSPLGAGPYKYIKYEDGVVYFEANDSYFLGAPKTKYLNFQQCMSDDDKLNGVITGTIDIADPSFSNDTVDAIEKANGGELDGDKITTNTVDNLGYGYLGISSACVNVGGEPGSEASKDLRKAFATVFSVYRNVAIESYYGERASVINYPISNTSWAAPQPTDDGYKVAFSVDVNGNDIYTSDMTAEQRYDAEGNRDEDLKDEGDAAHHEGEPDAVVELFKHRHGVEPAVAEITADGGTEPGKITGNDALIHVVHGIELRHPIVEALRARLHGLLARHILNEGSRQAAHQRIDNESHKEEDHDGNQNSFYYVFSQANYLRSDVLLSVTLSLSLFCCTSSNAPLKKEALLAVQSGQPDGR